MGEVYRARDESLERDVALKILPPSLVMSEERVRRFVLEARAASSLNHPHIITIHEIGEAEVGPAHVHFISMELVAGDTLWNRIHRENASLRSLLGWLAQAAEGLAKAHAAGIVHRDLKPGNIMVSRDGYAKVLDFGLAKLTEKPQPEARMSTVPTEPEHTAEGVVLGTAGYMSPEQVQGRGVDHRSDIFSFGCMLYEAATRRMPFTGDTVIETMHRILHDQPAPVEELNPEAPAELRRLIRRCLAKDPNQRLDSMKALALELQEMVAEYETLTPSSGARSGATVGPVVKGSGRGRVASLVAGGALVVVAAAVAAGLWSSRRQGAPGTGASFQSMRMIAATSRGDVTAAALSPDGRYLAYACGPPQRRGLWVRQLATETEAQILAPQGGNPLNLIFSPDGTYLFYQVTDPAASNEQTLYQTSVLGGTPRKRSIHTVSPVTLSPDGQRIAFLRGVPGRKGTVIILLDLESGLERELAHVTSPVFGSLVAWSPDGRQVATTEFVEGSPSGVPLTRLVTYDVNDATRRVIGGEEYLSIASLTWMRDGQGLLMTAGDVNAPFEPAQIWFVPYPGGGARRVTNDLNAYTRVSVASDGTIAAVRPTGVENLWVIDAVPGGGARRVTSSSSFDASVSGFTTTPEGSILYTTVGQRTVRRIGVEESGDRVVFPPGSYGSSLFGLPRGGIVYTQFGEKGGGHMYAVEAEGGSPRQLASLPGGEYAVDLSPDGRTILFRSRAHRNELWTVGLDGKAPMLITEEAEKPTGMSAFSPDGTRILYSSIQEVNGRRRAFNLVQAAGGEKIGTIDLPDRSSDVEWSLDGESVTFLLHVGGATNVFRQRLEGGNPQQVTRFTDGQAFNHEVSPDGRRFLLSRRTDHDNIWTVDADGSHPLMRTHFDAGQLSKMEWIPPDGRRAVFKHGIDSSDVVLIRGLRFDDPS